jgi:hypothetical protein
MAKEETTMASWMKTMMAVGMAVTLFGAGAAFAKHDGHGKGKGGSAGQDDGNGHRRGPGGDEGSGKHGGPSASSCDAASSVILAFVDMTCPCAGTDDGNGGTTAWKNHGQYVRCVAHAVRDAARSAGVKRRCAKGIVPCAAQSSCGKKNAVTCVVATTGTCTNGACSNDATVTCVADADCAMEACAVVSADRCVEAGGVAASGSCCSASPSGAFLD